MAAEHAGDRPLASGPAAAAPARAVREQEVGYGRVGEVEVRGFLAEPAAAQSPPPGVIVIHEWWGLNDNIRAMARQLAAEGYAALAVDLYGGRVATEPAAAQALFRDAMERSAASEENLLRAYRFLADERSAPRIAVLGWCFGGAWSLRTALLLPDRIAGTVIYYGTLVTDRDRLAPLGMPILGHFGAEDRGIPLATVREFETTLGELGKDARIFVYPGADHAFANPSGTRYQADAARAAWQRTREFLAETLRP